MEAPTGMATGKPSSSAAFGLKPESQGAPGLQLMKL